jgi:hypothetical protein
MNERQHLLQALRAAVEPETAIEAAWLEGADAAGYADDGSDIDLWLDVRTGAEDAAFELIRSVLRTFGPVTLDDEFAHPDPLVRQRFLGSEGLPSLNFVDVCVQTHGRQAVFTLADPCFIWVDRAQVIQRSDTTTEVQAVQKQLEQAKARSWRFMLVEKELRRGHLLEALNYYHVEVLQRLITALRLVHCPEKATHGFKHVHRDLPSGTVARLLKLSRAHTVADLRSGVAEAQSWLSQIK